MAKAPDPKQVAAQLAAEEAAKQAAEVRAARERMVMWIFVGGERRVLRWLDITARQVRQLRQVCDLNVNDLWFALADPVACPFDTLLAGWWLAGLTSGVEGEQFDGLLDRRFDDAPWLHFPSEEEIAADSADSGGDLVDPLS